MLNAINTRNIYMKIFPPGKCRRKINIKRKGGSEDSQSEAEEFRSWLESFTVRSPGTFNCTLTVEEGNQ